MEMITENIKKIFMLKKEIKELRSRANTNPAEEEKKSLEHYEAMEYLEEILGL